jgi:hypothetical protein
MTEKDDKPKQSKDNIQGPSVEFDPEKHYGALSLAGRLIIIEDGETELDKLPEDIREALIKSTTEELLVIAFATRGIDGVEIEPVDLDKAEVLEAGYQRGLSLLAAKVPDTTLFSG